METSNIAIKPSSTRLHRLIILRFVYSFGQSSNVTTCLDTLRDAGVNVGTFNHETIQVHSAISSLRLFTQNTSWNWRMSLSWADGLGTQLDDYAHKRMGGTHQHVTCGHVYGNDCWDARAVSGERTQQQSCFNYLQHTRGMNHVQTYTDVTCVTVTDWERTICQLYFEILLVDMSSLSHSKTTCRRASSPIWPSVCSWLSTIARCIELL